MKHAIRSFLLFAGLAGVAAGCAAPGGGPGAPGRSAAALADACTGPGIREAGVADGASGAPAAGAERRAAAHVAACALPGGAAAQIEAQDMYLSGRAEGVAWYCSAENAAALGAAGATPTLTCPGRLRARFAEAYAAGVADRGTLPPRAYAPSVYAPWAWGFGLHSHGRHGHRHGHGHRHHRHRHGHYGHLRPSFGLGVGGGGVRYGLGLGVVL